MSDYGTQVASKAYDILVDGLQEEFRTFRKTPMLVIQPSDLPVLGVYVLRERRNPDGEVNQTVPKFIHQLTLGFSGAINVETDEEAQMLTLEETMTQIDELLLRNVDFIKMIEGVNSMDRVSQYSKTGEISLGEIRVEMTVQFRSQWEPIIPDDFKTVHVTTQFPDKAHADSGTPQIIREYEIEQNE